MKVKITNTLPLPKASAGGKPLTYPFDELCIGQSFSIKGDKKKYQSIRSAANKYGKKHGKRFVTRFSDRTITVWRDKLQPLK